MPIVRRRTTALLLATALGALLVGCSDGGGSDTAAEPVATTPSASPTPTPSPTFPPEAEAEQGGRYWAVFLSVERGSDATGPEISEALRAAEEVGYEAGAGDLGCTQGAAEALGLDPALPYVGVSIFFASAELAQQFVDAYEPGVVGTAEVTAYCLD